MTIADTDLMSDYSAGRIEGIDLGVDVPGFAVEVHGEQDHVDCAASVVFVDYSLAFHAERLGDEAPRWFKPDGWPSDEGDTKLQQRLREILAKRAGVDSPTVWEYNGGGDDPYWGVSIHADYREGETVRAWFDRIGWPIMAALINCTDPGTFNYPYLYSDSEI